jgi:hypothetical protein
MPSSFMSLEKPRSLTVQSEAGDAAETTSSHAPAPLQSAAPFDFSNGRLPGCLFLANLSDPDPCITPRTRERRHRGWLHDDEEKNWL